MGNNKIDLKNSIGGLEVDCSGSEQEQVATACENGN
jgi:hypothetical protein